MVIESSEEEEDAKLNYVSKEVRPSEMKVRNGEVDLRDDRT